MNVMHIPNFYPLISGSHNTSANRWRHLDKCAAATPLSGSCKVVAYSRFIYRTVENKSAFKVFLPGQLTIRGNLKIRRINMQL